MIRAILIADDGSKRETEVLSRSIKSVNVPVLRKDGFGQVPFKLVGQHDDYMVFRCFDPAISFRGM